MGNIGLISISMQEDEQKAIGIWKQMQRHKNEMKILEETMAKKIKLLNKNLSGSNLESMLSIVVSLEKCITSQRLQNLKDQENLQNYHRDLDLQLSKQSREVEESKGELVSHAELGKTDVREKGVQNTSIKTVENYFGRVDKVYIQNTSDGMPSSKTKNFFFFLFSSYFVVTLRTVSVNGCWC